MNSHIVPELQIKIETACPPDIAINLDGVSVRYRAPVEHINSFKDYIIHRFMRRVSYRDFWALRKINLEIHRGEIFGIIGRNGAGKSTLLKVVSRVLAPTEGRVWVNGYVTPLLELGAGFHPELTGRENIYLNGTLLGYSRRDIKVKLDEILDFAEIGNFIDSPIRTFSSGMVARLGFAVATAWQPDILVLDEVLAVGDEAFRAKCQARMKAFRANGTTTLLVTHDMNSVQSLCQRAVWLDLGKVCEFGAVDDVIKAYRAG